MSPFYKTFLYIRDRLLHMTDPQSQVHYKKTGLSLKVRIQTALDLSPVRLTYALRTALLLSAATLLVQFLGLPHGKWLLFTLASVSLPYADDVPLKMKKRFLATALGGAVFMSSFGFQEVGSIVLIRLGYIILGIAIGYVVNCLIFPFSRAKATKQLWEKYTAVTELLCQVCQDHGVDVQLYYHLVIQAHLLEEKLAQNAVLEQWDTFPEMLHKYQKLLRHAHRTFISNRADAPVFDA